MTGFSVEHKTEVSVWFCSTWQSRQYSNGEGNGNNNSDHTGNGNGDGYVRGYSDSDPTVSVVTAGPHSVRSVDD